MILCDIGNTYLHFYNQRNIWKVAPQNLKKDFLDSEVYYISVCPKNEEKLLRIHKQCFDIGSFVKLDTVYQGMGVDRRAACLSIFDGIVVDAGSAITIDVMHEGMHLGGCILPGLCSYAQSYEMISDALKKPIKTSVSLEELPQNTQDAMSFGILKSIKLLVQNMAKNKKIFLTGGDGKFFSTIFENSIYDEMLIFRGMEKILENMQKGV
ncbi:type III pantothenate kinase [Helicobacter anatolicus]|uniref:type III pantothenate kinase n=1 Tax=Helicobacter anatolicus TaxID=2905874 RepID=UPI001E405C52|nr:type III pantothenate kinase [Helicobacter anatolicus]MCE3037961.1 type III pantothenate kinase [Helicobacter anatolicus]